MGVEPTGDGVTRRPPVLKTGADHRTACASIIVFNITAQMYESGCGPHGATANLGNSSQTPIVGMLLRAESCDRNCVPVVYY